MTSTLDRPSTSQELEPLRDDRAYYSVTEAAALLGVSRVTIWRWIGAGQLAATQLGYRTTRIRREDVELTRPGRPRGLRSAIGGTRSPRLKAKHRDGGESVPCLDWHAIDADKHFVQFYETDTFLIDAVSDFVNTALSLDEVAIVVATSDHRANLEERLRAEGQDLGAARSRGLYVSLDAAETLEQFMVDGLPDPDRFMDVIGSIIDRAAWAERRVHIFGEMVALLTLEGNYDAALRLEELWNALHAKQPFALFCAYPMQQVSGQPFADLLNAVCREHSSVIPAESYSALTTPDDRLRAIALLQQKAEWLETEIVERKAAEAALREESRITETLARIGSDLTATLDAERIVETVTDAAIKVSGAAYGAFAQLVTDEQGGTSVLCTPSGSPMEAFAFSSMIPRNTNSFRSTFGGEGAIRLADVMQDPRYDAQSQTAVRSYLAVPVNSRSGETLGTLLLGHPKTGAFSERGERLVSGVAGWAGIALDNAHVYASAQASLRMRERFVSMASHEFRTPLTSLLGFLQLAERRAQRGPEAITPLVSQARAQAVRLTELVEELLDVGRVASGHFSITRESTALASLVHRVVESARAVEPPRDIRLEVPESLPVIEVDAARLEEVLTNLLENARKYSPDQSPIWLSSRAGSDMVAIAVRDEGIGIALEDQGHIFEPFHRATNVEGRPIAGLGLGLHIAHEIVVAHGGTLTVDSQPGKGSTFTVTLPMQHPSPRNGSESEFVSA